MDASSSSHFYSAKAEESLSTAVNVVAGLAAMTVVGAERTEYYSARCEAMMRSRGQFSDDAEMEIAFSTSHCSEVSRVEVAPQSAEEEELNRENKEVCRQLEEEYPQLFGHDLAGFVLGRMIAKGGQAKIYEIVDMPRLLMKVFERGTLLRDLLRSWPLPVLKEDVRQCIWFAGMLEDGRFAFLMERFWGDLRKLIDKAMLEKNVDDVQGPPFPYTWWERPYRWNLHPIDFMLEIAYEMCGLHEKSVSHRDLKASNILLSTQLRHLMINSIVNLIVVADFECSIGVLGTGFWRAPEILASLGKQETISNEQWMKADVYSYGMTCFEIVTGRIPFDGELRNTKANRQLVIEGKRPQLPSALDEGVTDLITKCWEPNPSLRPTFFEILDILKRISSRQCEFRLFGIGDELPPQYRLATIEEVDEYTSVLARAMPEWEIANLANGSVDGRKFGFNTRLEKRSNVGHKLARFHQ